MTTRTILLLALAAAAGCAPADEPQDPSCVGDKCDEVDGAAAKTACDDAFVDLSGRKAKVKPASLNDAIAKSIFKAGDGCPLSFPEVIAKMRVTDADVMKVNSLWRDQPRQLQVVELAETLPIDDLRVPVGTRLDPRTCTLTSSFVVP